MFKFWEYPISFRDPASVYAYHMFSTHHGIMWYIIIILILVYWCLYKIIQDFTRSIYNKPSILSSFMYYIFRFKLANFLKLNNILTMCQLCIAYYYYFFYKFVDLLLYWYLCCLDIVVIIVLLMLRYINCPF